jgi:hypothetical protein
LQVHAPQAHAALQVWVPLPSQVRVAAAAQVPCPEHAEKADHVPSLQVRVSVPQLPQACEAAPGQAHWPA